MCIRDRSYKHQMNGLNNLIAESQIGSERVSEMNVLPSQRPIFVTSND